MQHLGWLRNRVLFCKLAIDVHRCLDWSVLRQQPTLDFSCLQTPFSYPPIRGVITTQEDGQANRDSHFGFTAVS